MMMMLKLTTTTRRPMTTSSSAYHHHHHHHRHVVIVFFMSLLVLVLLCVIIGSLPSSSSFIITTNMGNNNILMVDAFAFSFVGTRTTRTTRTTSTTALFDPCSNNHQHQRSSSSSSSSSCCVYFPHYATAAKKEEEQEQDTTIVVTEEEEEESSSSSSSESTTTTTTTKNNNNDDRNNNNPIIIQQQQQQHTTGPSRNTPRFEKQWNENYKKLMEYNKIHGNCDVSTVTKSSLSMWVTTQRTCYKNGRLKQHRIDLLNDIGFKWNVTRSDIGQTHSSRYRSWDETYNDLMEFYKKNGHCNVPQKRGGDDEEGNYYLGRWVITQRRFNNKNKLLQERKQKLDELNFNWEIGSGTTYNDKLWLSKYNELQSYKEDHGDCNVPANFSSLGIWVNNQRAYYRKGKLRKDRKQLLDDIGFEFSIRRTLKKEVEDLKRT